MRGHEQELGDLRNGSLSTIMEKQLSFRSFHDTQINRCSSPLHRIEGITI